MGRKPSAIFVEKGFFRSSLRAEQGIPLGRKENQPPVDLPRAFQGFLSQISWGKGSIEN